MEESTRRERLGRLSAAAKTAKDAADDARTALHVELREADAEGWSLGELSKATERPRSSIHTVICRPE